MEGRISYRREMKHNYLMIEGDTELECNYETRMMLCNSIEGLLRFRIKKVDIQCYFCYEITSRQPLSRLLESKHINAKEIRQMMMDIAHTLTVMEGYLLKEEQILLEPDFIYVEPELFRVELCLLPGRQGDFPGDMSRLLEYLLGKVEYQDKDAVVIAYGLYRESMKENYGMTDLFQLLGKEGVSSDHSENIEVKEDTAGKKEIPKENIQNVFAGQVEQVRPNAESAIGKGQIGTSREMVVSLGELGIVIFVLSGSLIMLWLLLGRQGVNDYGIFLVAGEVILMGIVRILKNKEGPVRKEADQLPKDTEAWQMEFREDQCEDQEIAWERRQHDNRDIGQEAVKVNNTVLLLDMEEASPLRKLVSMQPDMPHIPIGYYPFIIGKQENLVDYMFARDTISRLHLRLDEQDGKYRITDLNSTNGTSINGRMLETHETTEVKPGDIVDIANFPYKFI